MSDEIDYTIEEVHAARKNIGDVRDTNDQFIAMMEPAIERQTAETWGDRPSCVKFAAELQRSYLLARHYTKQANELADQTSAQIRNFVVDLDEAQFAAQLAMADMIAALGRKFG